MVQDPNVVILIIFTKIINILRITLMVLNGFLTAMVK
uniref:Uncharacterized protein n=1 Tax=virus sp. ctML55 TaxID=2827627 RepID=A0A8S5RJD7_9VIRU|nr:MAG TPA: hypothetical protein [virus sp. ctML55]